MNTETKLFPITSVISVVTGISMQRGLSAVQEILEYMAGEAIFTHQIPRAIREAAPVLLARYPALAQAVAESEKCDGTNALEWLATWTDRYGDVMLVPKMGTGEHERIDPFSEMAEKRHPDKTVIVRQP